jgi:uncharacterized protein YgiM (DUF1202 family)
MHTLSRLRLAVGLATLAIALPSLAATTAFSLADRVNVRSRPGYAGEILTQLNRHQPIAVLGTNTLSQPAPDEPAIWLRIGLPSKTTVWVASDFVETNSYRVTADVLNVRSGPSYDHAIIDRLPQNSLVQPAEEPAREGWLPILSSDSAFGFVPASWVTDSLSATPADPSDSVPVASPATIPTTHPAATAAVTATTVSTTNTQISPAPAPPVLAPSDSPTRSDYAWFDQFVRSYRSDSNASPAAASAPLIPPTASTPPPTMPDPTLFVTEPAPVPLPAEPNPAIPEPNPSPAASAPAPIATEVTDVSHVTSTQDVTDLPLRTDLADSPARFVRREGVVVRSWNIAAPSPFSLRPVDGGDPINFLITSRDQPLNLRELRGRTIIVTGREYLDRRTFWRDIPLLDVESIEAVR